MSDSMPTKLGDARVRYDLSCSGSALSFEGFAAPEKNGRWTNGELAIVRLPLAALATPYIVIAFEIQPFILTPGLGRQRIDVLVEGNLVDSWNLSLQTFRMKAIVIERESLRDTSVVQIGLRIPTCASPASLGLNSDERCLGIQLRSVTLVGLFELPSPDSLYLQLGRRVGGEASKSWDERVLDGFWSRYITGRNVLDIGFRGYGSEILPIVEGAVGIDIDYPGYNGVTLPFPDGSQDAIFSSHCLEHIANYLAVIQDWMRVVKVGGHIITAVPSAHLYERGRRPPSRYNDDHKRFYTPASLLAEFESALDPNSYRVRFLEENDRGYTYSGSPDVHPQGCYEIVLVIQKIESPTWSLRQ